MYKYTHEYTYTHTHMEELKGLELVDELIAEATRINATRKAMKQLGFNDTEIYDMVDHFVVDKIKQPMED